ncbi:MAG: hypothetical protein G01um101438_81 [Parcubacteria group bacterium Gr01-1014_38]|nr:MAG: hypothetical protein G01um101438_81 [Parcubacteria group bacterium Gr01-1014_38]
MIPLRLLLWQGRVSDADTHVLKEKGKVIRGVCTAAGPRYHRLMAAEVAWHQTPAAPGTTPSAREPDQRSATIAAVALTAFALLAWAVARRSGFYDPWAIILAFGALVVAGIGLRLEPSPQLGARAAAALPFLLAALIAGLLIDHLHRLPVLYPSPDANLTVFRAGILAAGLIAASYALPALLRPALRFPALAAVAALLGSWSITASPAPHIDTWVFHQRAAGLLLERQNPYEASYPNIYTQRQAEQFYGSARVRDGRFVYHYNYPPASILAMVPGFLLLGDIRWSLLAATIGAAALTRAACRRLGAPPGHACELALAALLLHPRGFFVLELSWSDPLLLLGLTAVVWTLAGERGRCWRTVALAGLLAVKQYSVLSVLTLWAARRTNARAILTAVALAAAVALPFVMWGPRVFFHGVILFLWSTPARADALALGAVFPQVFGWTPPPLVLSVAGIGAALGVGTLLARASRASLSAFLLYAATVHLAFFLFNKYAFANYHWFIGSLFSLSAAVAMAERAGARPGGSAPLPAT